MKHIKKINELFGVNTFFRKKFNSDEDIATDILNRVKSKKYTIVDPTGPDFGRSNRKAFRTNRRR
jgi:hypothetical protein